MPDELIPAQPRHERRQIANPGRDGGPSWSYRGAKIHANAKQTLFSPEDFPPDVPGNWSCVGNAELLMRVLDSWLDHGVLPAPYKPVTPSP